MMPGIRGDFCGAFESHEEGGIFGVVVEKAVRAGLLDDACEGVFCVGVGGCGKRALAGGCLPGLGGVADRLGRGCKLRDGRFPAGVVLVAVV